MFKEGLCNPEKQTGSHKICFLFSKIWLENMEVYPNTLRLCSVMNGTFCAELVA